MPVIVRDAGPGDARAIAEITVHAWRKAYAHILPPSLLAGLVIDPRERFWHEQVALGDMVVLVAETESGVIGSLGMGEARDADCGPEVWEVFAIYVDPASWRMGAGRRLLDEALSTRLPDGIRRLVLWVLEENGLARSFYEQAGFALEAGSRRMVPIGRASYPEVRYSLSMGGQGGGNVRRLK